MPYLTGELIDRTRPGAREFFLWDTELTGFGVKISPSGRKTYILQWRDASGSRSTSRRKLANVADVSCEEARLFAKDLKAYLPGLSSRPEGEPDLAEAEAFEERAERASAWLSGVGQLGRSGFIPRADRTKSDIVTVARDLFLAQGYDVSLDLIAQEAGLTKPTIYKYFSDKDDLFKAAIAYEIRASTFELNIPENVSLEIALLTFGRAFRSALLSERAIDLLRLAAGDMRMFPDICAEAYELGTARLIGILTDYIESHQNFGFEIAHPAIFSESFLAAIIGLERTRLLLGTAYYRAEKEEQYIVEVVRFFMAGLASNAGRKRRPLPGRRHDTVGDIPTV